MNIGEFSQLGIGLATLLILWFVVRYFIEAINRKDSYIMELVKSFNDTINNHMKKETESFDALTRTIKKISDKIGK